ncbi:MAG: hypothetical protein EPN92_11735 [Chitinophagaceae bacterium]|nr:MAG: hypothetical protein EPN92_11735 [Chitinophagaceae bacterium]
MKIGLFFSSVLLLTAVSCQKESAEIKFSPSQVLTPGKWQLKRLTIEVPPGSGAADITNSTFDPCELDDTFEFNSNGSFTCTENALVCPINTGIFYNLSGGNWSLSADTLLTIAAGFNVQKFKFGTVTANSMELQQTQLNYLGDLTRYTFLINK